MTRSPLVSSLPPAWWAALLPNRKDDTNESDS